MPVLLPDLLYRAGSFQPGLGLEFTAAGGTVTRIVPAAEASRDGARLPGRALLPGFVNAHSHAFQRLIRGRTQWRRADGAADFWSWRGAMYDAALGLSPEDLHDVSRFCFIEMLRAGITAVGEFHYLHRDPDGRRYDDPLELSERVLAAAQAAGIRIRLLFVAYAAGGIGRALGAEQRRFAARSLDEYLADAAELHDRLANRPLAGAGIAPHSVRAVPAEWLAPIHAFARERALPFHIHASEQPAEVEESFAAHGLRPIELLAERGVVDQSTTVVHATHASYDELGTLASRGATVCACPTTERDLGDGILHAETLLTAGGRIALGTDSQTVIDPFEEMRLLEYHERLRTLRRVVLATQVAPDRCEVAPLLLATATLGGARSLGIAAGQLEPGAAADFVAVDLDHRALAGATPASLPALLALSAPADVVTDVWVAGEQRVQDRAHAGEESAARAFRAVTARVGI